MLKESYKGFLMWKIGIGAATIAIILILAEDMELVMRLILLLLGWSMAVLDIIVLRTEQVYWYFNISYGAAATAGSERRRAFAWKHLRIDGGYALSLSALVWVMHMLGVPVWIDYTVGFVGLIVAGCFTIPIKL